MSSARELGHWRPATCARRRDLSDGAHRPQCPCAARTPGARTSRLVPRVHDHVARSDADISPLPLWNTWDRTLRHAHVLKKGFDTQRIVARGGHGVDLKSHPVCRPCQEPPRAAEGFQLVALRRRRSTQGLGERWRKKSQEERQNDSRSIRGRVQRTSTSTFIHVMHARPLSEDSTSSMRHAGTSCCSCQYMPTERRAPAT